jgi:hypothetical protein
MTSPTKNSTPTGEGFSLISNQKLLALYAAMRACRKLVEKSTDVGARKSAPTIHGHEAAFVGAAIDLHSEDRLLSLLLTEAVVRTANPHVPFTATSEASALDSHNPGAVTVAFVTARMLNGVLWRKVLDRAIHEKLPTLFVSLDGSGARPLTYEPPKIRGYAFPSITVDGHDVVAVYRVASEAIAHARKGHGPTLIQSVHVSPGCPLGKMEDYLAAKGLVLPS